MTINWDIKIITQRVSVEYGINYELHHLKHRRNNEYISVCLKNN